MDYDLRDDTNRWLESIESDNTRRGYKKHIDDFCEFLTGVPLKGIYDHKEFLDKVDFPIMLKYKNFLSQKYSGQTIRTKYYAIKSWLEYLYKLEVYNVLEPTRLKLDKKTIPKHKGNNGSKPFTHNEMTMIINKARDYNDGEMKSILLEMAYITAWRKEALLNLQYGNIYKHNDKSDYWLVNIVDKGDKEDTKAIPDDLYQRILSIRENPEDDDFVFPISSTSVDILISILKRDLKIVGNKSFHGIKKASISRVLDLTDNLFKAQKHACHENIQTTAKFYLQYNKDYDKDMSLHIMDNIDDSVFEKLSKQELVDLIKSSSEKVKFALLLQIKK